MEKLKQNFIAWLRKRGHKPHSSNILHLKVGAIIGLPAAWLSFIILCLLNVTPICLLFLVPVAVAFAAAYGAGYWKEKKDGKNFDKLDLYSTAAGGLLSGTAFVSLLLILITLHYYLICNT